ncbi:MAG TPA: DUF2892 domain-containing protein [Allosphingosinicella sp.]|jgi:hypothetical protein
MFAINLPSIERLLRIGLGLSVAAWAYFAPPQPAWLLVAVGACVALTGIAGFCPACAIAGRGSSPGR